MAYENVIVERENHVGIIILNRPEQLNTFNTALASELCKALLELENDKNIRVVVLKNDWVIPQPLSDLTHESHHIKIG